MEVIHQTSPFYLLCVDGTVFYYSCLVTLIFVELFISMYKTQNYRHKLFHQTFLPWWKKFSWSEFSQIHSIWCKVSYCSCKLKLKKILWSIFHFLKPALFLMYSRWYCCRCSLAQLADGEMTSVTWYFYTPRVNVLWWMLLQLWRQLCGDHTQKPLGLSVSEKTR